MEKDSDYSSPDGTTRENSEDENLQLINKLLMYEQLCEELKKLNQSLDENRNKLRLLETFGVTRENSEDEDLQLINKLHMYEQLYEELKKFDQLLDEKQNTLRLLETFSVCKETSQSPPPYEEWPVSPIASPIHESQDLSEDSFEHLPYSPVSIESLNQSEVTSESNEALHQSSIRGSNDNSPQNTWDYVIQADRTGAEFTPPQSSTGSEENYDGKGKEAANPKFRYKKRSKPEVSSIGASSQETTVKPSEDASGAQEIDMLEAPTSKTDITRVYLSVKRKVLDSDESCSKRISKLSGTHADDNDDIKINRKLNFDDDEMANIQCPNTTLLSQKKYARSDPSKYIDQFQADQSRCEGEQLAVPSTSGLSEVVSYGSSSEELSPFSGSEDVPCSERGGSSSKSLSDKLDLFTSTSDESN